MLENLRRKSLTKTYNDRQVHFESGLAKYENHAEIDVCTQRLSKNLQQSSFPRVIDTISLESFSYFKLGMIYCQSGSFTMGHEDQDDNKPRTEIIERPFLLGETEITQELYEKVMNTNPSHFKNPKNPVENISWGEAILFCNKLSELQGLGKCYTRNSSEEYDWLCDFNKNGYRLPKEKEWEYAAKAGTENRWAGTDNADDLGEYAWFGEGWDWGTTHPVKTKLPNEWGFYDMSGNVREWCWDKYDPDNHNADASRVTRGGSWISLSPFLRSAFRDYCSPGLRYADLGFRVCRSIVN